MGKTKTHHPTPQHPTGAEEGEPAPRPCPCKRELGPRRLLRCTRACNRNDPDRQRWEMTTERPPKHMKSRAGRTTSDPTRDGSSDVRRRRPQKVPHCRSSQSSTVTSCAGTGQASQPPPSPAMIVVHRSPPGTSIGQPNQSARFPPPATAMWEGGGGEARLKIPKNSLVTAVTARTAPERSRF